VYTDKTDKTHIKHNVIMITISCCAHCRSINFIGLPYHKTNAYGLLLLYLFISLQMAVKYINNNGLALDRVHNSRRPLDRFHYFALSALWPCDLNLWPFSHKITSLVVYPNIIPNTKFEHFWIIRLWVIVRTDRQTDRRTDGRTDRREWTLYSRDCRRRE